MARRVGLFKVEIEVARPARRLRFLRAGKVLVDTGSDATWIASDTLRRAGVVVRKRDERFTMANGQTVSRDVGYAIVRSGEFETIDEVVFANPGDLQLLGARTLEGFHAKVDARGKRLVASGPIIAACAC